MVICPGAAIGTCTGAGGRGGRRLAQFAGRDRRRPQVPGAATPTSRKEPARRPLQDAQRAVSLVRTRPGSGASPRIASAWSASRRAAIWRSRRRRLSTSGPTRRWMTSTKLAAGRTSPCWSIRATSRTRTRMNSRRACASRRGRPRLSGPRRGRSHQRSRKQRGHVPAPCSEPASRRSCTSTRGRPRLRRAAQRPSLLDLDAVLRRLAAGPGVCQAARRP